MSIPVACQCGQRFLAQPHLAGQVVRCPVCGQGIGVPAPMAAGHAPQAAPSYAVGQARAYSPPKSSGAGPLLYLGIFGGVLVVLMLCAGGALLIGYDVARTMLKKPSDDSAKAETGSNAAPRPSSSQENAAAPKTTFELPSVPSLAGPPGKWRTHTSEWGKFSVSLPGELRKTDTRGADGSKLQGDSSVQTFTCQAEDSSMATVIVIDHPEPLPPSIRDRTLEQMMNALIMYSSRTDGQYEKITVAKNPGLGIRYSRVYGREKVSGRAQTFEVNGRIYQLLWVAPAENSSAAADHFFSSFKLLPGAGSAILGKGGGQANKSSPAKGRETPPGVDGLAGPVVIFQMLDYKGSSPSGAAAKSALSGSSWFNGSVVVNHSTGEIMAGRVGSSIDTAGAKRALEAAGFKIGFTSLKSSGR